MSHLDQFTDLKNIEEVFQSGDQYIVIRSNGPVIKILIGKYIKAPFMNTDFQQMYHVQFEELVEIGDALDIKQVWAYVNIKDIYASSKEECLRQALRYLNQ